MASLSVRRIDDGTYERLRERAAAHGVSLEEEVRRILHRAVEAPDRSGQLAVQCFGKAHGVELALPPRENHPPLAFTE